MSCGPRARGQRAPVFQQFGATPSVQEHACSCSGAGDCTCKGGSGCGCLDCLHEEMVSAPVMSSSLRTLSKAAAGPPPPPSSSASDPECSCYEVPALGDLCDDDMGVIEKEGAWYYLDDFGMCVYSGDCNTKCDHKFDPNTSGYQYVCNHLEPDLPLPEYPYVENNQTCVYNRTTDRCACKYQCPGGKWYEFEKDPEDEEVNVLAFEPPCPPEEDGGGGGGSGSGGPGDGPQPGNPGAPFGDGGGFPGAGGGGAKPPDDVPGVGDGNDGVGPCISPREWPTEVCMFGSFDGHKCAGHVLDYSIKGVPRYCGLVGCTHCNPGTALAYLLCHYWCV